MVIASAITDISTLLVAIATAVSSMAALLAALRNGRKADAAAAKIDNVHRELRVGNGKTVAALNELSEGRRIRDTVAEADRTDEEQGYVDGLEADDAEQRYRDVTRKRRAPKEDP